MKICIDGLSISMLKGTGFYSYSYNLIAGLLREYPQPDYEMIWDTAAASPPPDIRLPGAKAVRFKLAELAVDRKHNDFKPIEEHLKNSRTDLYHSPNNGLSIPENKVCKYVITVHDLFAVSRPDLVDDKYREKFTSLFPRSVTKADRIIAVSEFIKSELIKFYCVPDKKISVIHPICSPIFRKLDRAEAAAVLRAVYGIEGGFVLYAGSIHPRKNIDTVIKALQPLIAGSGLKLVIAGSFDSKRREYYEDLSESAKQLDIEKSVIFTGQVPYEDMPYFYNCAECTVNLSVYDGYPTTAVEAAACGSPVVCLRGTSFEEILGRAALYLDEPDPVALRNMVTAAMNQRGLLPPAPDISTQKSGINSIVSLYESAVYGS